MEKNNPYTFAVVDADIDFLIIKNPFCKKCFVAKLNTTIISKYFITKCETQECISHKVRAIRILCECKRHF